MAILGKVEDRPTPSAVYNWRVYALAAVSSFASCMIGYDSAFIGTTLALPSFRDEFAIGNMSTAEQNLISANIVSLYQAGAFFGALAGYVGGYFLGRRIGILVFTTVFMVGSGIMLASKASVGLGPIYAGRVLSGFAVGGTSSLVPMYISELSPPAIRGRLVAFWELGWQVGGLVGFWINYGISQTLPSSHSQWLIPFAVQLIPGGLLLIGTVFFVRESPRWLYSKGRREEGLKNLLWIRKLNANEIYIIEEVAMIDNDLEASGHNTSGGFLKPWKILASDRQTQWRFFVGTTMFMWQNATGINAINYYSPTVFKSIGITGTNTAFFTTGLYGVVKTAFTVVFLIFLIDQFGRRKLLFAGSLGGAISMFIIGAFIKLQPPVSGTRPLTSSGIAAVFFFYLWSVFYSPTWNPIPWIVNAEIYDIHTRPLGQAFAACSNWFWNFIISRFTPNMFTTMGYGVYFFFASLMICSMAFVWLVVPETKGVPLESVDRLFEVKPARKAHGIVMAELRDRDEQFREHLKEEVLTGNTGAEIKEKLVMSEHVEQV